MDYSEVKKKALYTFVSSVLTGLSLMLATDNVNITWIAVAGIGVTALASAWNVFLQANSPAPVKGTGSSVNWASRLRKY